MRLVVGLGGHALLRRGEPPDLDAQHRGAREAIAALVPLCRAGHELVITHGNGPQVGLLALPAETPRAGSRMPLDVLVAASEGMIGYLLEQELRGALPGRDVTALLTLVEVDADDPALRTPTKPIGPVYPPLEGARLARTRGWRMTREGRGVRRAVPSPIPLRILEIEAVKALVKARHVVVCGGGGGIPVVRSDSALRGVEAVVDKDRTASLLAEGVGADGLLLLTDVPGVYEDFGTSRQRLLRNVEVGELGDRSFDPGSMGPKVEAACRFVERTGGFAAIGALEEAEGVLSGAAGTLFRPAPVLASPS